MPKLKASLQMTLILCMAALPGCALMHKPPQPQCQRIQPPPPAVMATPEPVPTMRRLSQPQ